MARWMTAGHGGVLEENAERRLELPVGGLK